MKVVLINPRNEEESSHEKYKNLILPSDLLAIAQPLVNEGYDVKIMDESLDIIEKIVDETEGSLCVGIKIFTSSIIKSALNIAKKIKEKYPDIPIVFGGWHASILPIQTIQNKYVDIVVKGPGEITFLELIKKLGKKESLKNIKGLVYKKDGEIVDNGDRGLSGLDLNGYDILPYHLLNIEKYITKSKDFRDISYISSRGCPYDCKFCSDRLIYKKRIERSAENTLKDIKYFVDNYKVNYISFQDTNLFVDKKKIKEVCDGIIKNRLNIKFIAAIRVDQFINLGEDLLKLIKKAGGHIFRIGAESGSQEVLDFINKKQKVEEIIKCAELIKKYEFIGSYSFMVGFPTFNGRDIPETLNVIKRIKSIAPESRIRIFFYTPYPGTPLYPICIKNGFKEPQSLEEWANYNYRTAFIWSNKEDKKNINRFIFYLKLAYPDNHMEQLIKKNFIYKIAHKTALFRMEHDFLKFPIMWDIYYLIKGAKRIEGAD